MARVTIWITSDNKDLQTEIEQIDWISEKAAALGAENRAIVRHVFQTRAEVCVFLQEEAVKAKTAHSDVALANCGVDEEIATRMCGPAI